MGYHFYRLYHPKPSKRLKVLAVFADFKGTANAHDVADTVLSALSEVYQQQIETKSVSVSSGGPGFAECIKNLRKLPERVEVAVLGPCGEPRRGWYFTNSNKTCAAIDASSVISSEFVPRDHASLDLTTAGVGQLIRHAYSNGCRELFLGLGGAAPSLDGGIGALQQMGVRVQLTDSSEPNPIYGHHALGGSRLSFSSDEDLKTRCLMSDMVVHIASSTPATFVGTRGVAQSQIVTSNLTPASVPLVENAYLHMADSLKELSGGIDIAHVPCGGAAGGLGGALLAVTNSDLADGTYITAQEADLRELIKNSDIILTGEGCYDGAESEGKVVTKVYQYADEFLKPVVVICGEKKNLPEYLDAEAHALVSYFPVEQAMGHTRSCLKTLVHDHSKKWPAFSELRAVR
eukprot:gnl/Spiro4/22809_TR11239_c0_g1_i1.p1 gnl/Spiro4/22809_TR11239_c0_g1~~gnl/Spiro4/22809_TR11239_c0_g1_i1.p1  ORF type:complete len:448 (+),score=53.72 gnl/Spiro4/22809_TR11239_c0_g1_i1:135-1346(+)